MKDESYVKISKARAYLSILGEIRSRALFGGYSLSVDNTIFAMVAEGELYLRASEQSVAYFRRENSPLLTWFKRGRQVSLNYYKVDEALWQNPSQLIELSSQALEGAKLEKAQRACERRLKDLPNISTGIHSVEALYRVGAKRVWIQVRKVNRTAGTRLLLALAGAITGQHEAALPKQMRRELLAWAAEHIASEERRSDS